MFLLSMSSGRCPGLAHPGLRRRKHCVRHPDGPVLLARRDPQRRRIAARRACAAAETRSIGAPQSGIAAASTSIMTRGFHSAWVIFGADNAGIRYRVLSPFQ
jgi:hypothetical protein